MTFNRYLKRWKAFLVRKASGLFSGTTPEWEFQVIVSRLNLHGVTTLRLDDVRGHSKPGSARTTSASKYSFGSYSRSFRADEAEIRDGVFLRRSGGCGVQGVGVQ